MDLMKDPDYYATLCKRLGALMTTPHKTQAYAIRVEKLIDRVIDTMAEHDDYDVNDIAEANEEEKYNRRERDEMTYEDYLESFAPVEHPGDSWKDNEDL